MKKIFTTVFTFVCLSALNIFYLSSNSYAALPTNYEKLMENPEVKKITYSCVFDNKKYPYTAEYCQKTGGDHRLTTTYNHTLRSICGAERPNLTTVV